jgi:uncharacterized membrane protein
MNRKLSSLDAASVGLLVGGAIVTAAIFGRLPARVPIHFGADGLANGWTSRTTGALMFPLFGALTWALVRFARSVFPASWGARLRDAPMAALGFSIAALITALHMMTLHAALHPDESIGRGVAAALGAQWIAFALVLPRLRRNRLVGIRTPWTLASDENWLRTHRVAAQTFAAAGAGSILAALVAGRAALVCAIVLTLASGAIPTVYSYRLARRLPPQA